MVRLKYDMFSCRQFLNELSQELKKGTVIARPNSWISDMMKEGKTDYRWMLSLGFTIRIGSDCLKDDLHPYVQSLISFLDGEVALRCRYPASRMVEDGSAS